MKNHPARRPPTAAEIAAFLQALEAAPARIAEAVDGLSDAGLRSRPRPKGWSAVEILAHLRACADVWGDSILAMLAEDEPSLPEIGPRDRIHTTDYNTLEFWPSWRAFQAQRLALLALLRPLPESGWNRAADIGGRRHSVFSQARRMAKHEQEHCEQLEALRLITGSRQEDQDERSGTE